MTEIETSAFGDCKALSRINIPESVTGIGDSAFNGCKSLTSITIPASVTDIGYSPFFGCDSLVVTVSPGSCAEEYCMKEELEYNWMIPRMKSDPAASN